MRGVCFDWKRRGYSPETINNHLAVLHRIFAKAIEYSVIEKSL